MFDSLLLLKVHICPFCNKCNTILKFLNKNDDISYIPRTILDHLRSKSLK